MLKIYNSRAVTTKQRLTVATIYGLISSIILGVLYGLISSSLNIEFSIVFIAIGYLIGTIIKEGGHGVQIKFSIIGAICAALCFILADLISFYGFEALNPTYFFDCLISLIYFYLNSLSNFNGILGIAFRIFGIITAFNQSRIF